MIDHLHFIRPWWLIALLPLLWLYWRQRRKAAQTRDWGSVIDPHLLDHLLLDDEAIGGGQTRRRVHRFWRPEKVLIAALLVAVFAVAGPTWKPIETPFSRDSAPLVVVLKLTPSMLAQDQAPSRLQRALQKVRDLLQRRTRARTALVAYAGSAHTVLPLSDDASLITLYLESLHPSIMPVAGDNPQLALNEIERLLQGQPNGTVLWLGDGIDRAVGDAFASYAQLRQDQQLFLALGGDDRVVVDRDDARGQSFGLIDGEAPGVDWQGLQHVAERSGGAVQRATVDESDIDWLMRNLQRQFVDSLLDDQDLQWLDAGYALSWIVAMLMLLWARRGWTVQW
ncbi:VWA domain-containing protein [Gammaproteobacteria bacterium]|nr:VWA domain-containing protein [Gammaproteobacteria bacterium]